MNVYNSQRCVINNINKELIRITWKGERYYLNTQVKMKGRNKIQYTRNKVKFRVIHEWINSINN